jgi:hypothetical protein
MSSLNFEVVEQSHATSVSQIFEAVDPKRGGRYLIEVLSAPGLGPWLDAFKQDMAVLSTLQHPCVLQVVDVGTLPDGAPVVVSERPEGTTLGRWLDTGRVAPTDAAMDLLTGIAHALDTAHAAGVSHGALCAEDVLLVAVPNHAIGFPRLRGFGHRWLRAAVAYGNAPVMLPGQGERSVPAGRREVAADIAALASLADTLLTPLQRGPHLAAVIRSAGLGEDRFASPSAFVSALDSVLAEGGQTTQVTDARRHRQRALRRVLITAAVTAVAAAALHTLVLDRRIEVTASVRSAHPAVVVAAGSRPPASTASRVRPTSAPGPRAKPAPRPRGPRLWRIWSDRAQKVVLVDDHGELSARPSPP